MKTPNVITATSRNRRVLAGLIDSVLSGLFGYFAIVFSSGRVNEEIAKEIEARMKQQPTEAQLLEMLLDLPVLTHIITIGVAVMVAYYFTELLSPYSPGKYLIHIKIVSSDGTPSSFMQRLVRFLVKHVPYLALLAIIFDPNNAFILYGALSPITLAGLALIFLPDKMALHDYVAKTKVIDVSPSSLG